MIIDRRKFFHYLEMNRRDWFDFVKMAWAAGLKSSDTRICHEVSDETAKNLANFVGVQPRDLELKFKEPELKQMSLF